MSRLASWAPTRHGIGTVVVAHFDEPIRDRAAAERRLSMTNSLPSRGSWYWIDDQNAHWRPQQYFAPGTVFTAAANIYGIPLGNGLYGQEGSRVIFRIGDAHVSIADDQTKREKRVQQRRAGANDADIEGNGWY